MIAVVFWLCVTFIVYTYAGYPLLVSLLARLRPRKGPYPPARPSVTLLIAAYNEESVIGQKIENCLALDDVGDPPQILVAADGSEDATLDIVRAYASRGLELSHAPARRGKAAALNHALSRARGDVVVFSDANNLYQADTLRELVAPFADPVVGAVTGAKLIARGDESLGDSEGLYWKYESFIKRQETRLGCCVGVAGEVFAIRRELFEPPPENVINDDFFLAMRIVKRGYKVVYAPRARSIERVSPSARDEMARRARIVAGRYQALALAHRLLPLRRPLVVWQIVSHKFMRPLVPFAMAGALLANLAAVMRVAPAGAFGFLRLASPANWMLLCLQAGFYGLAWVGGRAERTGVLGKLLYIPTFLVNSNLAAVIGLFRFVFGRQTPLWERVQRRTS